MVPKQSDVTSEVLGESLNALSPMIATVATDVRPDFFYLVDASDEFTFYLKGTPGVVLDKKRLLIHRSLVVSDPRFKVVYTDPNGWAAPKPIPSDTQFNKLYTEVLRPYQREFIDFTNCRAGSINADDTGTGKTLQALLAAKLSGFEPVLVVGTLLSRATWCGPYSEPKKWFDLNIHVLEGRKHTDPEIFNVEGPKWFFVNYDILEAWLPWIFTYLRPKVVVFDEAHNATPKTKRGRAAMAISRFKEIRKRIVLSATPIRNKRLDLWSILELAAPDGFADRHGFGLYYCAGESGEYGWVYEGETHNEELKSRLKTLMVRRTKSEIMKDLPPLTRQMLPVDLAPESSEEYGKYKDAERDIRKFLATYENKQLAAGISGERLVQLTKMLSILSRAKMPTTIELAEATALSAGKVVVFCWFKDVAAGIAAALRKKGIIVYGAITGDDPVNRRVQFAKDFAVQPEPCAYVATLAAASESINQLAACQELIINDLYWQMRVLLQAEGRLHRGGQKGNVHVVYPIASGTIDEDLLAVLYRKGDATETIGIVDDGKQLVKNLGAGKAPSDDLDMFVSLVTKQIADDGGYSFDGETTE